MRPTSDARDDTEDRDPYDAEPVRSDPWAGGPGHLTQDEPTERHVPEQRDPGHDSHDGHLYASDTYAEPETTVLPSSSSGDARPDGHHDTDEPTAVGVAHVGPGTDTHKDTGTGRTDDTADETADDTADDTVAKADHAEAKADHAEAEAEEARAEAERARADGSSGSHDGSESHTTGPDAHARHEPEVETVALPPAAPVAVVEPVGDRPGDITAVAVPVPVRGRDDGEEEPTGAAEEPTTDLKPGDVPVEPVTAFLSAEDAQGLRDRWREAQFGFVDDPRQAVEDVKALVGEAVDRFTSALSAQRDALDTAAGEDTEEYRVAVRRYRAFFDRLLDL